MGVTVLSYSRIGIYEEIYDIIQVKAAAKCQKTPLSDADFKAYLRPGRNLTETTVIVEDGEYMH